jgi:hypothetical protein
MGAYPGLVLCSTLAAMVWLPPLLAKTPGSQIDGTLQGEVCRMGLRGKGESPLLGYSRLMLGACIISPTRSSAA